MIAETHLILMPGAGMKCQCKCGDRASRFIRCRKKRCVIALCASSGDSLTRKRDEHEEACK